MAHTHPCPRCGQLVEDTTLPRSWTEAEVVKWRRIERAITCDECAGLGVWTDLDEEV